MLETARSNSLTQTALRCHPKVALWFTAQISWTGELLSKNALVLSHQSQDGLQSTSLAIQLCANLSAQFHMQNIQVFTRVMIVVAKPKDTTVSVPVAVRITELLVQKLTAQQEHHDFMHRFYRRTRCGHLVRK